MFLILHQHADSTFIFSFKYSECELWHEVKINLTLTTASLQEVVCVLCSQEEFMQVSS